MHGTMILGTIYSVPVELQLCKIGEIVRNFRDYIEMELRKDRCRSMKMVTAYNDGLNLKNDKITDCPTTT